MRRLYPGLSLYLLACDRRFPTIIGQINGAERKGRRENNREGRTQRGQCVGSGIVIVSTRYLDQPASRLGLPRHAGVKDLLFLFLHWNPIGKSAEAFVRSLARSHSTSPPSSILFFLALRYPCTRFPSFRFCETTSFAVIRIRTSSNRGNKTTPTFPRAEPLSLSFKDSGSRTWKLRSTIG